MRWPLILLAFLILILGLGWALLGFHHTSDQGATAHVSFTEIDKVILWNFGKKRVIDENSPEFVKLRKALFNSSNSILDYLTSKHGIEPFECNFSELRNKSEVVEFVFKHPSNIKACYGNSSKYVCYSVNIIEVSFVLNGEYEGYVIGKRVNGGWIVLNDKDKSWMNEMKEVVG